MRGETSKKTELLHAFIRLTPLRSSVGIARAVAGEAGTQQDQNQASYATEFTEEEHWVTPQETRQAFQRKCTALNLFQPAAKHG